ncbi:MAG: transaldolase [Legionellales bacterium]|nr:transaldolase [Legionellales bacterium]
MTNIESIKTKIFLDSAGETSIVEAVDKPYIQGFTTNPTLMLKSGVVDYEKFAKSCIAKIKNKTISFEVFSDDIDEIAKQAEIISTWGDNVYVKIPITNTKGESLCGLIKSLTEKKIKVNITAIMTLDQVKEATENLTDGVPSYVSVFAGRIADTGIDPLPIMKESVNILKSKPGAELIWASTRELFNIFQAESVGCHIITIPNDIYKRLSLVGYDLKKYSLDTVKMFYKSGKEAKFSIG